jgi:hypothetical protein
MSYFEFILESFSLVRDTIGESMDANALNLDRCFDLFRVALARFESIVFARLANPSFFVFSSAALLTSTAAFNHRPFSVARRA